MKPAVKSGLHQRRFNSYRIHLSHLGASKKKRQREGAVSLGCASELAVKYKNKIQKWAAHCSSAQTDTNQRGLLVKDAAIPETQLRSQGLERTSSHECPPCVWPPAGQRTDLYLVVAMWLLVVLSVYLVHKGWAAVWWWPGGGGAQ